MNKRIVTYQCSCVVLPAHRSTTGQHHGCSVTYVMNLTSMILMIALSKPWPRVLPPRITMVTDTKLGLTVILVKVSSDRRMLFHTDIFIYIKNYIHDEIAFSHIQWVSVTLAINLCLSSLSSSLLLLLSLWTLLFQFIL